MNVEYTQDAIPLTRWVKRQTHFRNRRNQVYQDVS